MTQRIRVEFVKKANRYCPNRFITRICGTNADGSRWELTEQEAIAGMQRGIWAFYVTAGKRPVEVVVERPASGPCFLKTAADKYSPDTLLALVKPPLRSIPYRPPVSNSSWGLGAPAFPR